MTGGITVLKWPDCLARYTQIYSAELNLTSNILLNFRFYEQLRAAELAYVQWTRVQYK